MLSVCLSVTVMFYADTYVSQPPVRGGVLDAPRSCDRRAALDAPVRRGRLHLCLLRCTRLCPHPNVCDFAGTARAPFVGVGNHICCRTSRSVCLAPTVRGGVLDAPCAGRLSGRASLFLRGLLAKKDGAGFLAGRKLFICLKISAGRKIGCVFAAKTVKSTYILQGRAVRMVRLLTFVEWAPCALFLPFAARVKGGDYVK